MDAGTLAKPMDRGILIRSIQTLWRVLQRHYFSWAIAFLLIMVVAAPITMLVISSFREGSYVSPGAFTFRNYKAVYLNSHTYPAIINTVIYATVGSVISLLLSIIFAWLIERTDMPGRNWAWSMMLLPLGMPAILRSMAWILLLQPRTGIINVWLRATGIFGPNLTEGPVNIYTLPGMIFVATMGGTTTLFLLMVGVFRLMDPSMEEAAWVCGANKWTTMRRVTLGLTKPAILAAAMYSFLSYLDDFDIPLLIGLQAGIFLLPTLIYFTAYVIPSHGLDSAYSTIFLIFAIVLVWIYYRVAIRRSEKYATITGKGFRPRRLLLGRWRWVGLGLFIFFFIVNVALPFLTLAWASFLKTFKVPSREALQYLTLQNYVGLFQEPLIVSSWVNTFILSFTTATTTMGLAFLISWVVIRLKVRGGVFLDAIAFIPHSIPAVAIALALVIFYLHPALRWMPIYGTMGIMVLAIMARYLAFATRTTNSAMVQLHKELEEAAQAAGANRLITLLRITFPLLLPPFIAGWVWVFAHTLRNFSIPLMLATPKNQTIAIVMYHFWERKADLSLASALGISLLVVVSILTIFSRRIISQGFTRTQ